MQSPVINELIDAFKLLPTIGPKSAQRLAYFLLQNHQQDGHRLASAIEAALEKVGYCQQCRNLSEAEVCGVCASKSRQADQLCIVEMPTDVVAIEQSGIYRGQYFVLMGHLSPIDGVGPDELGLPILRDRLAQGEIQELILATNPTVEGEATAHYIQQMAIEFNISVTRLAQGIPLGGELEYIDSGTLGQAFAGRKAV
ncbi:Recombination protein RecR [Hydrogenovibrio crunogenus]|uniref:Recombination protein RecR n=1 Tax=Hydrogenovibrio crunogenus TaxID=39765 RepID=A0A4P7NXQ6_9GAMM|nr:recombination mediator RecR [Hydrogenovibrio crunogenus]QBZ82533.1 Recombination protein RecR [Hydrogenovibrio crunogenus]RUM92817.1 MAG: recombination protein RecR [Thiomicrospira sp.]